jgi:hypothetical protein
MADMPQSHRVVFNVVWDEDVDVAYLAPIRQEGTREVAKTVPIIDRAQQLYGTIDLAGDGTLLGIELTGARRMQLPVSTDERRRRGDSDK